MTSRAKPSVGMAELIDAYDWGGSPIGQRAGWQPTLRLMVGAALASGFPMLVFWGRDLVQLYNDAFMPILGVRHPSALGQPARECWPETYFTFSYSRIGGNGEDHGLLCTCVETTKALLGALERAFATGRAYEAEIRIKPYGSGDDALRWHLLRAVPMHATDGSIVRWAGSGTDVHDRRAAGDALRRLYAREHEVSLAFQNVALPQRLPTVPGLVFDAMYEAAGEEALVGGDWYDAFRLPDGRVVISVGDVAGSGLGAAVTMGAVRQVIRGASQVFAEPAAVLDAADRALRAEQPDRIVTAFLGIIDPLTLAFSFASAGHPPPLLRRADGSIVELAAFDLPLGLRNQREAGANHSVVLAHGAMLVLYTDGLIEATRDAVEGERRLREALALDDVYRSSTPATAIRQAVVAESNDDVAILTVRVGPDSERMRPSRVPKAAATPGSC